MSGIKSKKVLIMAGGTGGHVIPALAVARYLQERNVEVYWLGTQAGIESSLVPKANIAISYIDIKGLRGKKGFSWFLAPIKIVKALWQSLQILRKNRPDVVLTMGGYVTGPGAIAAWILRIPFVLHEQNAVAGWTNKILSCLASAILTAFPDAFPSKKKILTGNPIRQEIIAIPPPEERYLQKKEPLHLLILGGSQGASILNEIVPTALALFPMTFQIWHQTGKAHLDKVKANYQKASIQAQITDFIDDMAKAYAWADIVICRSGALTIAELTTVGISSILIPFPFAVDDHQTANAKYLSGRDAAILLDQSSLTPEKLNEHLLLLSQNPQKRLLMAQKCRQLSKPFATQMVAEHCLEVNCGS